MGIRTYKHAQSPFIAGEDLTQTNDKDSIEDKESNNQADGWDYSEYDEYINKLGDDIEGVDE